MKDIDTVKRVRSWRYRQDYYNQASFDILRSNFIEFNFEKGEGYPGYIRGEIEYIDYRNPVNLWTKIQE
jgi:hypothetical protein